MPERVRLLCLAGPTGSGKSGCADLLADLLPDLLPEQAQNVAPIRIINADSRQIYADFPLITAQPPLEQITAQDMRLYGYLNADQKSTAWDWAAKARQEILACVAEGVFPVLVGGTGLYFKALLDGMADIPAIEPALRAALREQSEQDPAALYQRLLRHDPAYAAKISASDKQRIVRALEVFEQTGQPFSWWHSQTPPPVDWDVLRLGIGLPLPELEPLLARRIEQMLAEGALHEAEQALLKWPDIMLPGWSGIGCSELALHLRGKLTLTQAKALWLQNTRQYAKRQWTWFRADKRLTWLRPEQSREFLNLTLNFITAPGSSA